MSTPTTSATPPNALETDGIWVKNPLVTFDPVAGTTTDGGVVVQGQTIVERVAAGATPTSRYAQTLDASRLVLLPGLINTHHHFYQTLTRAHRSALNKPLFPWLQALYPVWSGLSESMVDVSTRLAGAELLLSGCTTAVDHHYVFPQGLEQAIDVQADAMASLGLRAVLTRGSMSLGESAGGLPPDSVVQDNDTILADSARLIDRWHSSAANSMCQIVLAPCSPFSVTTQLMRDTAELAAQRDVLLHTHLAETADENEFCLQQFGMRPVDYMEHCGWLNERAWFAHGIHFNAAEIERLGAAGCGVSHCPTSNMLLASGICPIHELEAAGVRVGLGVDGSASNDGSNMIQEARQALLLQRLHTQQRQAAALDESDVVDSAEVVRHEDALRWATLGGAQLIQRADLGRIAVGAAADLSLFGLDEVRFSGSEDPLAALLLCGAHKAEHVMVNGKLRVSHGELVDIDLGALVHEHSQQARILWA